MGWQVGGVMMSGTERAFAPRVHRYIYVRASETGLVTLVCASAEVVSIVFFPAKKVAIPFVNAMHESGFETSAPGLQFTHELVGCRAHTMVARLSYLNGPRRRVQWIWMST